MDGLAFLPRADLETTVFRGSSQHVAQQTLKRPIGCVGIGVHSAARVVVRLLPAPAGHGIVFLRTDLGVRISARYDSVVDTRLCTVLGNEDGHVGTVEHLMAALSAAAIDNVLIEVDAAEIPILDGSAEPWLFLLDCAGTVQQEAPRAGIVVLRTVRVSEGDAFAELRPMTEGSGLEMALSIDFPARAIGRQALSFTLDHGSFRRDLARARTFAQRREIEGLQQAGLARGGSLDNAVVVDDDVVLNPGGLRMVDEFVRHKMLDAVGDLALSGAPLHGRFVGGKSGHALNNRLLHALMADPANWSALGQVATLLAA